MKNFSLNSKMTSLSVLLLLSVAAAPAFASSEHSTKSDAVRTAAGNVNIAAHQAPVRQPDFSYRPQLQNNYGAVGSRSGAVSGDLDASRAHEFGVDANTPSGPSTTTKMLNCAARTVRASIIGGSRGKSIALAVVRRGSTTTFKLNGAPIL